MTDAWDGRPQNPERDGWHWLQGLIETRPWLWTAADCSWRVSSVDSHRCLPHTVTRMRYLGPALLPAQVAAEIEAEREACAAVAHDYVMEASSWIAIGLNDQAEASAKTTRAAAMLIQDRIRARGPGSALADALRQARAEAHNEIETRFWAIVDRDGLAGVPSDMWDALSRIVRSVRQAEARGMREAAPQPCDGKEQLAFEAWAKSRGMSMEDHPLHYLFLHPETNAARLGWNAALLYLKAAILAAADAKEKPDAE